jgi:large subunit ribosomal protein L6
MSRIGLKPISIPTGVNVDINSSIISVKGKLGTLTHTIPELITPTLSTDTISFARVNDEKHTKQLHGTTRALVANMITGVSKGYTKSLVIVGIGYRANPIASTGSIELSIGYSHKIVIDPLPGTKIVLKSQTEIIVEGIDKQIVGQMAALIRKVRKPEPYKGKGISYVGEKINRKESRKAKK